MVSVETRSFHMLVPVAVPYRKLCHLKGKNAT